MNYRKVLFIDPGTNFGWAEYHNQEKETQSLVFISSRSGAMKLTGETLGERVMELWHELESLAVIQQVDFLAWEEAAFSRFGKQDRMYGTWEGVLLLFCEMNKIPYMTLNQSTIKAYAKKQGFYGEKNSKGKKLKPAPRPEWKLMSTPKLQEHEIDSRWGLECLVKQLEEEE